MARDSSPAKIVIGRHVKMTSVLLRLRRFLGNPIIVHELHERAFPYLAEHKPEEREALERQTKAVLQSVDALFLTNFSQEQIVRRELERIPPYTIVPHGVEVERFQRAVRPPLDNASPVVITYTGHFVGWKSVDLLFQSLALLEPRFHLRIAGGLSGKASDEASREYIRAQSEQFGVTGRVDYRGFVSPDRLVSEVLLGSSVLALPLGDNFESRYFTCPIKLVEYISTQIPVVAVDYPSVRLLTGEDSVFLAADTPEAFAAQIRAAAFSPEQAARVRRMNEIARGLTVQERAKRADAWYADLVQCRRIRKGSGA
jgi:glycosyltransferase involved in cell wall biosynthesis